MCFHNVITQRQTQPRSLPGWFSRKNRLKDIFSDLFGNTVAIVFHRDQHNVIMSFCAQGNGWFVCSGSLLLFFSDGKKCVRYQIEYNPANILWHNVYISDASV